MPANFPSSPTLNQTYSYNGSTWSWTGSYWRLETSQAMTGIAFTYGNAAPSSPNVGDRWIDTTTMLELVYVYDGNSYQWVELSSQAPSTNLAAVSTSITPTANVAYDLGSSTKRWRDLYLSGNSLIIGGATITATGSAIALPSGTTVGGQSVASGGDVATGGGPKITNLQITDNSWTVLDDTAVDTAGGYVLITGTNFVSGAQVYLNQTAANSVAFVSATTLRVTVPALTAGTYIVYVINPDGGTAIRVPGLTASANPAWQTASALPEQYDGVAITLNLVATDATSYTLTSGSLPPGLSLNTGTGAITGTVTGVSVDTVYTFTVRATDAQLQDSPRTFTVTITVSDPYFKLTTLLLSGSAISANTVIRDSSTNNFNLTVSGDARASNFTPYGTGWSVYFDGTGDYLTIPNSVGLAFGTGDFTVEFWAYVPTSEQSNLLPILDNDYNSAGGIAFCIRKSDNLLSLGPQASGQGLNYCGFTANFALETWNHFVVVAHNSVYKAFLNGTQLSTQFGSTVVQNVSRSSGNIEIGRLMGQTSFDFGGYLSNFRVIKGTALYTANFTPATTTLTAVANTSLLTCHVNRFMDGSTNNFAITRNGDARVVSFNPFNITNTGVNGSMYFDGTGDYVATPSNVALSPVSSAFTLECWFYRPAAQTGNKGLVMAGTANSEPNAVGIYINESQIVGYNANASFNLVYSSGPPLYAWNHVALVRSGTGAGQTKLYLNGIEVASGTFTQTFVSPCPIYIGATVYGVLNNAEYVNAYIADVRFVKGSAVYTANFTPPTSPLTAIANTQLLTCQFDQPHNNHTFLDSSSNQLLITRNGNASQGTFSPFSQSGWSVYFDGSYDCIKVASDAAFGLGTGNFTIELWVNFDDYYAPQSRLAGQYTSGNTNGWQIYKNANSYNLIFNTNTADHITYNWSSVATNTWYHIAVVRSGTGTNQTIMYINGVNVATGTCSHSVGANQVVVGGLDWAASYSTKGYISSFRYSNIARTIVVPTVPYSSDANTLVLTCQSNRFIELSASRSITIAETPKIQAFSPFAPTAVYNPAVHGGSAYFDGTGDYVTVADNPALGYGTSDFEISFWCYPISTDGYLIDQRTTTIQVAIGMYYAGTSLSLFVNGSTVITGSGLVKNTWHYLTISRVSGVTKLFLNGSQTGSNYNDTNNYGTLPLRVGCRFATITDSPYQGYISDFIVIKGTGISSQTVPTAPLTATTNTQLLLNFTDAAIVDSTGRNVLETAGDAKSSSVVTKFTGGSISFDGTSDYLDTAGSSVNALGSGDWTIEFWLYLNSLTNTNIIDYRSASVLSNTLAVNYNANRMELYINNSTTVIQGNALSASTWYHIAVSKSGSSTKMFVNGTQAGSTYTDTNNYAIGANRPRIGSGGDSPSNHLNGYLSDIRITKGYARYTANFTAPTAPARLK